MTEPDVARRSPAATTTAAVESWPGRSGVSTAGSGRPLPLSLREYFEPRFGRDLGLVRIHTDASAAEAARALGARAFAVGSDIVFGSREYAPETSTGKRLLAHELAHVVQAETPGAPIIRRLCSPPQRRVSTDPNEGQRPGARQLPRDPCLWVLYGFPIASHDFQLAFSGAVNQLGRFLETHDRARLRLYGLNDCFGTDAFNVALSQARAQSVLDAFPAAVRGRIAIVPTDGHTYLVSNDTPLNRAINRSVQIEVLPPPGISCPAAVPLASQLSPTIARGRCDGQESTLLDAVRFAVPIAITAMSRVRDWRNNPRTRDLIDLYYATTTDAERQAAAERLAANLGAIIPRLQRPTVECMMPSDRDYRAVCPTDTIAEAHGARAVLMPTFCFPQFVTIVTTTQRRAMVVIHEFAHSVVTMTDFGAYYTTEGCLPTDSTNRLTRAQRLIHADTFACFVGQLALRGS